MPLTHLNPGTLHVNPAFSQGVLIEPPGSLLIVGGQDGTDASGAIVPGGLREQTAQALRNVLAVLAEAGGRPEHIGRMTAYCCDKPAYLAARAQLGRIWRGLMGKHFPAMSMIFVSDLLDSPGKIELEATAVIPEDAK